MYSIRNKEYDLIYPERGEINLKDFEPILQKSILLVLLEKNYLDLWQYEQCCSKLSLPSDRKSADIDYCR